ncbi:hypothetical protein TSUKUMMB_27430 [Rhodococcus sp. no. 34]
MVPDACLLFRGEDVAGSVAEEGQDVVVRPRRGIGQIHDDVGTLDCLGDTCAGGDVDPVAATERLHVVPGVSELGGDLASDESASENDDLHVFSFTRISSVQVCSDTTYPSQGLSGQSKSSAASAS